MTENREDVMLATLRDFATGSALVEFEVPWSQESLFLVPQAFHIAPLVRQGVRRGRIWIAAEARDLCRSGITEEDAAKVAQTKLAFDGTVTSVRLGGASTEGSVTITPETPSESPKVIPFRPKPKASPVGKGEESASLFFEEGYL